jgi:hypothetical protein
MPRSWLLTLLLFMGQVKYTMAQPAIDSVKLTRSLQAAGTPTSRIKALLDLAYF